MTTIRHLLPDFGPDGDLHVSGPGTSEGPETAPGDGFEEGYKAGWDDAVSAQEKSRTSIGSELARNLQDLSFTYHDAHAAMLRQVEPLFAEIIGKVLPDFARQSLAPMVAEHLAAIADRMSGAEVILSVHPDDRARVEDLLDRDFGFPVKVSTSGDLVEGQAMLRFGQQEREINLPEALGQVSTVVDGFFRELRKEDGDE